MQRTYRRRNALARSPRSFGMRRSTEDHLSGSSSECYRPSFRAATFGLHYVHYELSVDIQPHDYSPQAELLLFELDSFRPDAISGIYFQCDSRANCISVIFM